MLLGVLAFHAPSVTIKVIRFLAASSSVLALLVFLDKRMVRMAGGCQGLLGARTSCR